MAGGDVDRRRVALAQGTGGNKPTVVSSIAALGGMPGALFDGSNDFLSATLTAVNQPLTLFAVVNVLADVGQMFSSTPGSGFGCGFGVGATANRITQYAGSDVDSDQNYTAAGIVMFVCNGASSSDYEGTTSLHATAGSAGSNPIGTSVQVGQNVNTSALPFNGHIAELGVYSVALGSTDRETLRAYLAARYFGGGGAGSIVAVRGRGMPRGLNRGLTGP